MLDNDIDDASETMLDGDNNNPSQTMTIGLRMRNFPNFNAGSIDPSLLAADGISFYIIRLSRVIVVRSQADFFIGRNVQEELWKPLVNLADLDAFARSVSRRHAMIHPTAHGYEVTDLSSRNGTWLGDLRIVANKPYPLLSGTRLSVGQEQLMVMYRSKPFSR